MTISIKHSSVYCAAHPELVIKEFLILNAPWHSVTPWGLPIDPNNGRPTPLISQEAWPPSFSTNILNLVLLLVIVGYNVAQGVNGSKCS